MWILVIRLVLGVCFLILGVVGVFLPVLQGWLFFLLAAMMFFPRHRHVEKVLAKADRKFPRMVRLLRRIGIGKPEEIPLEG